MKYYFYVDGSTAPTNPGPSGYGFYGRNDNNEYFSGYGPVNILASNNVAEIKAVIELLKYLRTSSMIGDLTVYSDSQYVVNGALSLPLWKGNSWKSSKGTPIANIKFWVDLYEEIKLYTELGGIVTITWVKSHSNVYENEVADRNANLGRTRLILGNEEDVRVSEGVLNIPSNITSPPIMPIPIKRLTGLFSAKRWYFCTNVPAEIKDGRLCYFGTSYPDTKDSKDKNLGKNNPNTNYCVLLTKDKIEPLDVIRDKFNRYYEQLHIHVVVNLMVLCSKKVWDDVCLSGAETVHIENDHAVNLANISIGRALVPPRKAYVVSEIFQYGLDLIEKYESADKNLLVIDITNKLTNTLNKGKFSISKDFTQQEPLVIIKNVDLSNNIVADVKLIAGLDIPSRTDFLRILKEYKEIKINLCLWGITEHSFRVATVIITENATCIYYTQDGNYKIIPQQ